jgi:uncharacterized membrane protein (DUF4010 family)
MGSQGHSALHDLAVGSVTSAVVKRSNRVAGLTDMDAITLSVSHLVSSGEIVAHTGSRLLIIASMSNLVFKAAAVAVLGRRSLFGLIAPGFGGGLLAGGALIFFT